MGKSGKAYDWVKKNYLKNIFLNFQSNIIYFEFEIISSYEKIEKHFFASPKKPKSKKNCNEVNSDNY